MLDLEAVAEVVADAVKSATEPLAARLAQLEGQPVPATVADAMIDRTGDLIFIRSDGHKMAVGNVIGRDGKDGSDGRHGLSAEDVTASVLQDGRTVEFSLRQGEYEYSFELSFPVPLYRGVFAEDQSYQTGDMVTWGGSLWHCNSATQAKPGGDDAWTLAVKKGRDGRDGQS